MKIKKFELLYDAIFEALRLVDCQISHLMYDNYDKETEIQYASAIEFRDCHNKLLLGCKNHELIECFLDIQMPKLVDNKYTKNPMEMLNNFRVLARHELGFLGEVRIDKERTWFGKTKLNSQK